MKYYVYRHVRLDKNEVFYIGIGTKPNRDYESIKGEYTRAYTTVGRNKSWNNIIKHHKYKIEILFESNYKEEIWEKEIEFIKLYGRKDKGNGTLINKANGGKTAVGRIHSKEWRERQSKRMKGVNNPNFNKRNENSHNFGKKKSQYIKDKIGDANRGKKVSKEGCENMRKSQIGKHKGELNHMFGKTGKQCPSAKSVIDSKTKKVFASIKQAAEYLGIPKTRLAAYLRGDYPNKTTINYLN